MIIMKMMIMIIYDEKDDDGKTGLMMPTILLGFLHPVSAFYGQNISLGDPGNIVLNMSTF